MANRRRAHPQVVAATQSVFEWTTNDAKDAKVTASDKTWFKRGRGGVGVWPHAWQGWVCLAVFLVVLGGSVELAQALLRETGQGQIAAFIIAAIEIMGFMKFTRSRADITPKK